jgi:hypothetical protein
VSILVNNAGVGSFGGVLEQVPEDWDRVIETNLNACFLLSKLAAASMVKQGRGKIRQLPECRLQARNFGSRHRWDGLQLNLRPHGPTSRSRVGTNPETSPPKGPLAQREQAPPTPSNGAHIIVEGPRCHRIYQKQAQAGKRPWQLT